MSRVLYINGTVRPDGTPWSEPVVPWAWDGPIGTRNDPGETVSYASDRKSGVQRLMQRPFSRRGTLWLPASDVAEVGAPLRELARAGILLESAKTQELDGADWDVSGWGAGSCGAVGGERGPTGESTGDGQAYLVTPTLLNGNMQLVQAIGTNLNVDTYVHDIWARKLDGVSGAFSLRLAGGASEVFEHADLTDQWQRVQVTSPDVASATATMNIFPGGNTGHASEDTQPALVWAPGLINAGGAAGETDMGGGSAISVGETRIFSALNASFPWPAVPWTMRCDFTPFFGGGDVLTHTIWEAERGGAGGAGVYQLQKNDNDRMVFTMTPRGGGIETAFSAIVSWDHRAEQRVVIVSESNGDIRCYLNGVPFSNQIDAPDGLVAAAPDTIEFGGQSATAMDGILHSFELFDRALDPARLF